MAVPLATDNSGGHSTSVVPTTTSSIESLPQDMFNQIFSSLILLNIQAVAQLNKNMNKIVMKAANLIAPASINKFIDFLVDDLNGGVFSAEKKVHIISQKMTHQNFVNLRFIFNKKTQLIDTIKILDNESINDLKAKIIESPKFMEDIFPLSLIDRANCITDENKRGNALRNISRDLAESSHTDRAIDVAMTIPGERERENALAYISRILAKSGHADRAIEVAVTMIHDEYPRGNALRDVPGVLAKSGQIERAIDVAMTTGQHVRGMALQDICEALTKSDNIDRAIKVARRILSEDLRGSTLQNICEVLVKSGQVDRAIDVARRIPGEALRGLTLQNICEVLVKSGRVNRAIRVAEIIPDKIKRMETLLDIYTEK